MLIAAPTRLARDFHSSLYPLSLILGLTEQSNQMFHNLLGQSPPQNLQGCLLPFVVSFQEFPLASFGRGGWPAQDHVAP